MKRLSAWGPPAAAIGFAEWGRIGVSAEPAVRLEATLGNAAEMWIEMQAGFDLWRAGQKSRAECITVNG
jgi:plasmid maintenance system antidote protein VapI